MRRSRQAGAKATAVTEAATEPGRRAMTDASDGPPDVLNSGAAVPITRGSGTVMLVEGGTFCLSDAMGDIKPGTPHGLFFRDVRVISCWGSRRWREMPTARCLWSANGWWATA